MTLWDYVTAIGGAALAVAVLYAFVWILFLLAPENAMALTAPGNTR